MTKRRDRSARNTQFELVTAFRFCLGDDNDNTAIATSTQSVYQLASFTRRNERQTTSGKICFNLAVVSGCIGW
jgi:hypothetical protein